MSIGEFSHNRKTLQVGSHPSVTNPVIDGTEADDIDGSEGAADPFIVYRDGTYYAFVEIFNDEGTYISYYTSENGLQWEYGKKILGDGVDWFSYPLVIEHQGEWYMTPTILYEGKKGKEDFPLYKAEQFPNEWRLVDDNRITAHTAMDASPFQWNDNWYAIAQDREENGRYGNCRLYVAEELTSSQWTEHPESPIVSGPESMVRGFPITKSNCVDLFIGWEQVTQYRVDSLTPRTLSMSKQKKVVQGTWNGWNEKKMHHLDARLIAQGHNLMITDGTTWDNTYGVGIYTTIENEHPASTVEKLLKKRYQEQILHEHLKPYVKPVLQKTRVKKPIETAYNRYFGFDD